jgi:hypothetical protein
MKNKMAKPLGVTPAIRGRAASIRICVPDDLREAYGGRADFRISLGKVDWATAKTRATLLRAEKDAEFEDKRKAIKAATTLVPVPVVTPELSKSIALGVYAAGLAQDDALRESDEGLTAIRELVALPTSSALQIPKPSANGKRSPLDGDGLTEHEADAIADLNALADGTAATNTARRKLSAVQPLADAVARSMGLAVDWTTDSARQALKVALEEHRRAWKDRTRRDAGDVIRTPEPVTTVEPAKAYALADAFTAWKSTNLPSRTLVSKAMGAIALVDECLGRLPLTAYTKAHGAVVVAHMLAKSKTQKTALDKFNAVKALLTYAAERQGWIDANPWRAHSVAVKKTRKRVALPSDVLVKLFDSPLFKSYALPFLPR